MTVTATGLRTTILTWCQLFGKFGKNKTAFSHSFSNNEEEDPLKRIYVCLIEEAKNVSNCGEKAGSCHETASQGSDPGDRTGPR